MQRSASQSRRAGAGPSAAGIGPQREASPFAEPVGPAGDAFEREADRVAEAVVRGNNTGFFRPGWAGAAAADVTIKRKCADCEEEEEEKIRRAPRGELAAAEESTTAAPE